MGRLTHRKVESEEQAVTESLRLARRCQSNFPDRHPLAILVASVAHLRLAGWANPKDGHILAAGDRLVDQIKPEPTRQMEPEHVMTPNEMAEMAKLEPYWHTACQTLKRRLYDTAWQMWMADVQIRGGDNGTLLLWEPSEAKRIWIERRYGDVIMEAFAEAIGREVKGIRFVNWTPRADQVAA